MSSTLPLSGTISQDVQARLDDLLAHVRAADDRQVGYPTNQHFDFSPLLPFLEHSMNNIGDPFHRCKNG